MEFVGSKDIIKEGSRWRVGDGRTIEVPTQKWLSHKPIILGDTRPIMYVRDLIDSSTMQWGRKKILWLVCSQDSNGNTLLRTLEHDTLNWTENTNNVFTVKSAYREVLRMKERSRIEHSTAGQDRHHWKKIWTLNVPPKFRNFLWRACSNILPTRENLSQLKGCKRAKLCWVVCVWAWFVNKNQMLKFGLSLRQA